MFANKNVEGTKMFPSKSAYHDTPLQAPLTHVILLLPNHSNLKYLILVVLEVTLISK
jgi:hypothetical protein